MHGRDVPVMHKQRIFPKGAAKAEEEAAGRPSEARAKPLRPRPKALLADSDSDYDEHSRDAAVSRSAARPLAPLPLSSPSAPLLTLTSRHSRGEQTNLEATAERMAGMALSSGGDPQRDAQQHRSAFANAASSSPPLLSHPSLSPPSGGLLEFASSHPPSLLGRHLSATRPLRRTQAAAAATRSTPSNSAPQTR